MSAPVFPISVWVAALFPLFLCMPFRASFVMSRFFANPDDSSTEESSEEVKNYTLFSSFITQFYNSAVAGVSMADDISVRTTVF